MSGQWAGADRATNLVHNLNSNPRLELGATLWEQNMNEELYKYGGWRAWVCVGCDGWWEWRCACENACENTTLWWEWRCGGVAVH